MRLTYLWGKKRAGQCCNAKKTNTMTFSEIVNEVRELRSNNEFMLANFTGRRLPENTHPQAGILGFNQSYVWQQGTACQDDWHELSKIVMGWTTIHPAVLSAKEVGDYLSGCGKDCSYLDKMLANECWIWLCFYLFLPGLAWYNHARPYFIPPRNGPIF